VKRVPPPPPRFFLTELFVSSFPSSEADGSMDLALFMVRRPPLSLSSSAVLLYSFQHVPRGISWSAVRLSRPFFCGAFPALPHLVSFSCESPKSLFPLLFDRKHSVRAAETVCPIAKDQWLVSDFLSYGSYISSSASFAGVLVSLVAEDLPRDPYRHPSQSLVQGYAEPPVVPLPFSAPVLISGSGEARRARRRLESAPRPPP